MINEFKILSDKALLIMAPDQSELIVLFQT